MLSEKNETRISVQELTKVFSSKKGVAIRAVDSVSFKAEAGEVFGLLGVNGAGKTTTLRLLSTMLRPTAGEATICGFSIRDRPEDVRSRVGFMSTATSIYGRLTAREMVTYFGRLNRMSESDIRQRSDRLFDLLKMGDFADRRCDKLSTGMKQKVSIVRTVLHDPEVMIFDEPTAGLDVLTSRTIVEFIRDCRSRGKCVLLSSHIMDEVEKLCDRVGVIHEGRLLACEPIGSLKQMTASGKVEDAFVALVEGADESAERKDESGGDAKEEISK